MNHLAIYALYPQVVTVDDGTGVFDAQGNKVVVDAAAVAAWIDPNAYKAKRQAKYPPITDYIDGIVKGDAVQVQAYIDACLAVKQEFPK